MTFKVTVSSDNNYSIKSHNSVKYKASYLNSSYSAKINKPSNYKASFGYTLEIMAQNLNELADVEISGNNDQYVLMYDSSSGKWKDVNPNVVLSAAAVTEPTQPGLPNDFINTLDVGLDNKIDLDAGGF